MVFSWFTGLGLAAKIAIGATVMAVGAVGAGAAQALPTPIQQSFNDIVGTVSTDDETPAVDGDATDDGTTIPDTTTDDGTTVDPTVPVVGDDDGTADQGKTEHATAVTEAAHDDSTQGREHGEAVSEAAHQNRGHGADDAADEGDDDSAGEVESGDDDGGATVSDDSDSGSSNSGPGNSGHGGGKGKN
ncbi:hypothetical protein [Naasia aerilata]|uniref:Uncharacterized protein n=1 Tax=Naasia aerilata TaxID=1162966 RepID=A0ABN6XHS0_9MICO|nr:hypothetical protein [Naasia aerilata]BDZ44360.1 hypothetical protein GCM10025866_02690 [Naasia aerilata]